MLHTAIDNVHNYEDAHGRPTLMLRPAKHAQLIKAMLEGGVFEVILTSFGVVRGV